ncbi:MAG: helix-turn-helix domain-containing protein [Candidatus Woesearchaeota archaeon]
MKNPIVKIRKSYNLTKKEFANLSGVSYDTLSRNEVGLVQQPHKKILKALEELGHDPEKIRSDYKKYKENLQKKALQKGKKGN